MGETPGFAGLFFFCVMRLGRRWVRKILEGVAHRRSKPYLLSEPRYEIICPFFRKNRSVGWRKGSPEGGEVPAIFLMTGIEILLMSPAILGHLMHDVHTTS